MSDKRPIYHLDREREIAHELLLTATGGQHVLLVELVDLLEQCE